MLSKKVVIGVALTAIVVDFAICTVKGKDLIKASIILAKIGRYYQGRLVEDEVYRDYELLNEKVKRFVESLNGKKSRSFNTEDVRNAQLLDKEVEHFYNVHCI